MKKITSLSLFFGLLIMFSLLIIITLITNKPVVINQMEITLAGDSLFVSVASDVAISDFTPGKHFIDSSSTFFHGRSGIYKAEIPTIQRFFSFGQDKGMGFYHLTSGPFPKSYMDSLEVLFKAPGKSIFCQGKVFTNEATIKFPNMFVAREFPICWAPQDNFIFSQDSSFIFFWTDSSGKAILAEAKEIATASYDIVPNLAPKFWEKNIFHWQGSNYCTAIFLGTVQSYGLEHFNSPLIGIPVRPVYRLENQIVHEMFHSLVGKAIMPINYLSIFGGSTEALGVYEGLTSFIEAEYVSNCPEAMANTIASHLSQTKATKLGLMQTSLDARKNRGSVYYSQGFLFWLAMSQVIDIDAWVNWLFDKELIDQNIPIPFELLDVFYWLNQYQSGSGNYASQIYDRGYLPIVENLILENGFEPILFDSSSYYPHYFGPYHVGEPPYTFSSIDTVGLLNMHPEYVLVDGDSLKMGWYGPGTKLINQFPDSVFIVIFSYGPKNDKFITLAGHKRNTFPDGSPFFFEGKINLEKMDPARREEAEKFWQRLLK